MLKIVKLFRVGICCRESLKVIFRFMATHIFALLLLLTEKFKCFIKFHWFFNTTRRWMFQIQFAPLKRRATTIIDDIASHEPSHFSSCCGGAYRGTSNSTHSGSLPSRKIRSFSSLSRHDLSQLHNRRSYLCVAWSFSLSVFTSPSLRLSSCTLIKLARIMDVVCAKASNLAGLRRSVA